MIITRTPFRMSFFGGGTDFPLFYEKYGGSVISTTFDKYCYVNVRHLPEFFNYRTEIVYSKIERVNDLETVNHPAVREAMKYLDIHNVRVSYDADLPARSGLGTSSSFAVGMLNAFYALKGKCVDKRKLADDAIYLERSLCNEVGGIQDQISASFGGFNRIDFDNDGYNLTPIIMKKERKKMLNDRLMLFFTGLSRFSADIQSKTESKINEKTQQLFEIKSIVSEAEKILTSKKDLAEFGKLLDYTWKLKRSISGEISNDHIDELYNKALRAGALGGKLLGAGGGGFLLFYVDKENQSKVKEALNNLLYVPFEFETDGTRIIYYTEEDFQK